MPIGQGFSPEEVREWVEASCRAQGLPVKVSDTAVVKRVGVLLGGAPDPQGRSDAGRAHAAAAASTHRAARPANCEHVLESPERSDTLRVQRSRTQHAGRDHGVVQHGGDDRGLPVEVQPMPRSA